MAVRHAPANPVSEDEARRYGDQDASLPSAPEQTHEQAVAVLAAAFPGAEVTTRVQTDAGRWLDTKTGQVFDNPTG